MDNYYQIDRPKNFDSLSINEKLIGGNFLYTTSNLVCNKKVFSEIGGFSDLRYVHDYDFFLKLTSQYKVSLIKECLLKYRIHEKNTISENYSKSIFETGLVLADFFLNQQQKTVNTKQQCLLMEQFYRTLNTYSSERVMLTLLIFGKNTDLFSLMKSEHSLSFQKTVLTGIVDNEQLRLDASWLKQQTDKWWQQAQKHKKQSEWQKKQSEWQKKQSEWQKHQTDEWWQQAQKHKKQSEWQKHQTNEWWQQAQKYKKQSEWQKYQTDEWWQQAQKLKRQVILWKVSFILSLVIVTGSSISCFYF